MKNLKIKRVNEWDEERQIRILFSQMRRKKEEYIKNRKAYTDELERLYTLSFINIRTFTNDESKYLDLLFHKYLYSLNEYLVFRERLSTYKKALKELFVC